VRAEYLIRGGSKKEARVDDPTISNPRESVKTMPGILGVYCPITTLPLPPNRSIVIARRMVKRSL